MQHGICFLGPLLVHLASGSLENIALNKPAAMSSIKEKGFNASRAVDGKTGTGGFTSGIIIDTGRGKPFAWWKVDLQREVQSATVKIYFRTDYKVRRNGVRLYTSASRFSSYPEGQLCHTVTGKKDGSDIDNVYSVTCPGRWRYLLLYTNTDNDGDGPVLDFGEVKVEVCPDGTYGEDCTKTCSSRNCVTMTATCERDGKCPDGCQSGWTEVDCIQECKPGFYGCSCSLSCTERKCLNSSSPCDHVTGQCVGGCKARYIGIDCRHECPAGTFGSDCTSCSTRHCQGQSACPADGTCSQGCQDGWTGNTCTKECASGFYGIGCERVCGNCTSGPFCDHVTGNCQGGCKAGWRTEKCNRDCMDGTYGPDCTETCGKCDGVCDSVDGMCPSGCLAGYNGIRCDVALPTQVDGQKKIVVAPIVAIFAPVAVGCTLLLVGGVLLWLVKLGRLQWVKNPEDRNSVLVSRDNIHMDINVGQPDDVSEHAHSSCQAPPNNYDELDFETREDIQDYGVVKESHYENI